MFLFTYVSIHMLCMYVRRMARIQEKVYFPEARMANVTGAPIYALSHKASIREITEGYKAPKNWLFGAVRCMFFMKSVANRWLLGIKGGDGLGVWLRVGPLASHGGRLGAL